MNNFYQVKVIGNCNSAKWLEKEINDFLGTIPLELIDIKYQNWNENHQEMPPGQEIYSAMIIYKEILAP